MTSSSRGLGWLTLGLGVIALGLIGFGIISMIHTGNNVETHRRIVAEKDAEILRLARSPRLADRREATRLDKERYDMDSLLARYEDDRRQATFILLGGVAVLVGCVVCFVLWVRRRGKLDEDDQDDEDEDDEEEEHPRRRRRREG